ncbi:hypothetical protein ACHAW6_000185 [Cyclotella cf. meneghiniana]
MSDQLSVDLSFEDLDLHEGLFSLQVDSNRPISSSEYVRHVFLSDGVQLTQGQDADLPLLELTARFERITTGDDVMEENLRLSSSESVENFQDDPGVVGPMPQGMFFDSFSSSDAVGSVFRPAFGALPARTRDDESTSYDSALSSIPFAGGVLNTSSSPPPPLFPNDSGTDSVFSGSLKDDKNSSKSKTKKRRERFIDESTACKPTENDVLFGRGGFTNNHPGNIFFRQEALRLRPFYEQEQSKDAKYEISIILLESVTSRGGRFLEKGKGSDELWHEVIGNGARRKASQALRERIKGRSTSLLSASNVSARSHESSGDEHNDIGANESLVPTEIDLVEV